MPAGPTGVTDVAGNPLVAPFTWSFTTTNQAVYSIWSPSTVPSLLADNDTGSIELGVKFRSSVSGYITAIRYYRGPLNTGTHVASLWTSTGSQLATATFTGETASGWQQVNLPTPVPVAANTVYVASYHANNGRYSVDGGFFANKGVDSPPLRALADGESGGNGVYRYGTGSVFPNLTYNTENYWVDVVFTTSLP